MNSQPLTKAQRAALLGSLKARFESNPARHAGMAWAGVQAKLEADGEKLWALHQMEATGGEPDVVGRGDEPSSYLFADCAPESPAGRRNLCYDDAALAARKANKPQGSAVGMAAAMGIEVLTEEQYRALQTLGNFDLKTSSWVQTPTAVRTLGGALFCDRRYGR
ncbi:MAG: DUF4256 domain-containing protein, partial [Oscillospiraceae bacterium]